MLRAKDLKGAKAQMGLVLLQREQQRVEVGGWRIRSWSKVLLLEAILMLHA